MTKYTCPQCKGDGKSRIRNDRFCRTCGGKKKVAIDRDAILRAIHSTQGPNRGKLRIANNGMSHVYGAEYVWRMARFHGGADVTMPTMCFYSIGCGGIQDRHTKAVLDVLDVLADEVALAEFGTNMAAAGAWELVL